MLHDYSHNTNYTTMFAQLTQLKAHLDDKPYDWCTVEQGLAYLWTDSRCGGYQFDKRLVVAAADAMGLSTMIDYHAGRLVMP
jgi:hypothetical protein